MGPLTIVLALEAAVAKDKTLKSARDAYFNELIAWRELAMNFVKYTPNYDTAECAEDWAKKTIAEHARDERERLYSLKELEAGETYDELWNAAQTQMVMHGWMHNYLRMYWAKKILEWTPDVKTAVNVGDLSERQVRTRWARSELGMRGIAWSMLGRGVPTGRGGERPGVWEDPLHVGREHRAEVRFQTVHRADARAEGGYGVSPALISFFLRFGAMMVVSAVHFCSGSEETVPLTLKSRFVGNVYVIQCVGSIVLGEEVKALEALLDARSVEFSRFVLGDLAELS